MRNMPLAALLLFAAACVRDEPSQAEWDMGPMPPVAALYDQASPPATFEELSYSMTRDLAQALAAPGSPVDFDWRTWAVDREIVGQTFGVSETPPDDRADIVTRFTYPGVGDGMILTYTLCRQAPSVWKIEDIAAQPVPSTPEEAMQDAPPSLRAMLGLPPRSPACD